MRLLLFAACVYAACAQDYQLVWEDNFDTFDLVNNWDHEITAWGGGNSEFQVYTSDPANSYVRDGILYIRPTRLIDNTNPLTGQPFGEEFLNSGTLDLNAMYGRCTMAENDGCFRQSLNGQMNIPPVMSARVRTNNRFSFRYGRTRIRARMPAGDWLWPAMWLLPENWVYGGWPISGEIDLTEIIGNEDLTFPDGTYAGYQHMGTTLHWGPAPSENRWYLTNTVYNNDTSDYSRNWHIYEMEWTENGMRMFIDGNEIANYPNPLIPDNPSWTGWYDFGAPYGPHEVPDWQSLAAPFDEEFHFILNIAVGGTNGFIGDDLINRGGDPQYAKPWANSDGYYDGFRKFWNAQDSWYWTWEKEGEGNAMQVDYVQVYQQV